MKRTLLASLLIIVLGTSTGAAFAATPYVALKLGHNTVGSEVVPNSGSKHTNNDIYGFMGGISGGVSFPFSDMLAIRTELEYDYSSAKSYGKNESKNELADHKILVNGYLDIGGGRWWGLTPYVGLGLGYAVGTWNNGRNIDVNGFGFGLSVGTSYALSKNFSADLGFRWLSMSRRYDEKSIGKGDLDTEELSMVLGLRYAF